MDCNRVTCVCVPHFVTCASAPPPLFRSDDLSQQPFRLMFDSVDRTGDNTTFTFMLHADSMSTAMMGSMGADMDGLNARHNCSSMAVQWLELELCEWSRLPSCCLTRLLLRPWCTLVLLCTA